MSEQIVVPKIFLKERLDLLHVPYFNIPIFYPRPYIVTIHDLTILHFFTGKATTLPLPLYWLKWIGYYTVLLLGLSRAKHILTVSEATKQEIMDHFAIEEDKITVVHEGVGEVKRSMPLIQEPYILYVGNAYPHKNLETLISALDTTKLVLVGKNDLFYERLKQNVRFENVIFFGEARDEQLGSLYSHATALVFPSLMEGFGLPALEAAVLGTPVICSDIPAFREILGPLGNYFKPNDIPKLRALLDHPEKLTKPTKQDQKFLLARFNWRSMAAQTLHVYEQV